MPHFYFHYREDEKFHIDEMGIQPASVEAAFLRAYEGALDMWSELLRQRRDPRRSAFVVTDQDGKVMFEYPFAEALESCIDVAQRMPWALEQATSFAANAAQARRGVAEDQEETQVMCEAGAADAGGDKITS